MSNVRDGLLTVSLDPAWTELPADPDAVEEHVGRIVESFALADELAAASLAGSLRLVTAVALGLPPGGRRSYALIPAPSSGRVEAILSMRVSRVTDDAYVNYLLAAQSLESNEDQEVIQRTVEEVQLPAGRGILSRDFTLGTTTGGIPDPALERTFLALFPDDADTAVEFTLLTQNLALFVDAGEYILALAANDNPPIISRGLPT